MGEIQEGIMVLFVWLMLCGGSLGREGLILDAYQHVWY